MRTNFSIARKARVRNDIKEHKQRYAKQMLLEKTEVKTNANHIRAMSDEELAELFSKMCENMHPDEDFCEFCPAKGDNCPNAYKEDWIKWLKQPTE